MYYKKKRLDVFLSAVKTNTYVCKTKGQEMMLYCKETAVPVVLHSLKAFLHRKIRAVVSASGNGPV